MPVTWIAFDPHTSPYGQWKTIDEFTTSNEIVVIEYRSNERWSSLTACFGLSHQPEYSDITFGTVNYRQVRHAAAREDVTMADTVVVYAYGRQVGQSCKSTPPHPEELIEQARRLIVE
ncbi:hypothetical protein [Nocardia sp. NBC_01327]|uniref:hypothetical protein n=1 Tax=Nocardia sp. NBC_01327 TaxID=2903593 RepID=UPI002E10B78D|nr:hypothetical protein OG326_30780 [Nocardia sp. NBC_01327]